MVIECLKIEFIDYSDWNFGFMYLMKYDVDWFLNLGDLSLKWVKNGILYGVE